MDGAGREDGLTAVVSPKPKQRSSWGFLKFFQRNSEDDKTPPLVETKKNPTFAEVWEMFTPLERLKPSGKVLFHTAPEQNLSSLRNYGLYGNKTDPNVSANLGYSLFFAYEHAILRQTGSKLNPLGLHARETTPENYLLTVWRPNADVRKSKSWLDTGFLEVKGDTSGQIPEEYYQRSLHGSYIRSTPEDIGRVSPENLLAAIPLRREIRDKFLQLMVLAAHGRIDAEQIETQLRETLSQGNNVVLVEDKINISDLAHLLTVSLERELVRCVVVPEVRYCLTEDSDIYFDDYNNKYKGYPLKVLWKLMRHRGSVNDVATATYLDKAAFKIAQKIKEQGVDVGTIIQDYKERIEEVKAGHKEVEPDFGSTFPRDYKIAFGVANFYGGGNVAIEASQSMEKELGLM